MKCSVLSISNHYPRAYYEGNLYYFHFQILEFCHFFHLFLSLLLEDINPHSYLFQQILTKVRSNF
jgi:hypothetical protein